MKKLIFRALLLLLVLGAAYGAYRFFQQLPQRQQQLATAKVRQSDVIIRSYARGELRAVRSASLIAPNLFGTVQVTRLAALGSFAQEKDLVVEFDDSEVRSRVEEKQLELDQLDEQLKKALADQAVRNNQDQVELLRDQYAVRRAELEVKRAELKSKIDVLKDKLNLDEAERRLKQLESDIKSRLESGQAELAVLKERKNRAQLEMRRERMRLMQVRLLAPISGLVAVKQSRGMGGMFYAGMQLPDIREGDQVFPGTPVADVLDLSELEVAAKVGELDRANLREDQDVLIRLDAVSGKTFHGKIKSLSGTAAANVWSGDPAKKFDVVFAVDMKELLSGLGAKPEQIRKVLETAEQNRKKPPVASMASAMFATGGMPGGGPADAAGGPPGMAISMVQASPGGAEGGQEARGEGRQRGMRGFGGAQMSDEDRQKMRAAMEKALGGKSMQDLSPEERQKILAKLRESFPAMGGGGRSQGGEGGQRPSGPEGAEGRQGRRERGGGADRAPTQAAPGAPGEGGPPDVLAGLRPGFGMATQQFTEKDLENAKLPPPPEESNQLEVLLRPGLLADVEIIVEKIPNAIHIPVQAVFDSEGKPVVYVKTGNTFEPRLIKPLKRSESTMVIAEGLKAGELVALADPTARKAEKKGKKEEKSSGGSGPSMPVGGGAGGGSRGGR